MLAGKKYLCVFQKNDVDFNTLLNRKPMPSGGRGFAETFNREPAPASARFMPTLTSGRLIT